MRGKSAMGTLASADPNLLKLVSGTCGMATKNHGIYCFESLIGEIEGKVVENYPDTTE